MLLAIRPADEHVRALTEQILSQPEYARWREPDVEFLARFLRWIGEYLAWTSHLQAASPALFWLLVAGLLVLATALLAHVFWSLRAALSLKPPQERARAAVAAPRWVEEAERLAGQGRFLEAAHRLVLGSIDVLVARGAIELARADANRVLRERVMRAPLAAPVRARFLELLDAFEQRWFRDRVEDGDLYRAWRELHFQLREGAA